MKQCSVIFCLLGLFTNLFAQNKKSFTLPAGQSLGEILSSDQQYSYPEFVTGTVYKSNGTSVKASLNYNIFLGKMQYIYGRGDTLVITNSYEIDSIKINRDIYFVIDDDYYKKLAGGMDLLFFERKYVEIDEVIPQGITNSKSAGITNIHPGYFVKNHPKMYDFTSDKDLIFTIKEDQFYRNQSGLFFPRKSRVLNEYSGNKKAIKGFISAHSIKFNDTNDLIELAEYLNTLVD